MRMRRRRRTSSDSIGISRSELSKTSSTQQNLAGGLPVPPPLKMRSESLPARMALAERGPRTKRIESEMLDLPEPFGPVTAVNPPSNGTETLWPNDLKFSMLICFRCIAPSPFCFPSVLVLFLAARLDLEVQDLDEHLLCDVFLGKFEHAVHLLHRARAALGADEGVLLPRVDELGEVVERDAHLDHAVVLLGLLFEDRDTARDTLTPAPLFIVRH